MYANKWLHAQLDKLREYFDRETYKFTNEIGLFLLHFNLLEILFIRAAVPLRWNYFYEYLLWLFGEISDRPCVRRNHAKVKDQMNSHKRNTLIANASIDANFCALLVLSDL